MIFLREQVYVAIATVGANTDAYSRPICPHKPAGLVRNIRRYLGCLKMECYDAKTKVLIGKDAYAQHYDAGTRTYHHEKVLYEFTH